MVPAGDEGTDLESDATVEFNGQLDCTNGLILIKGGAVVGGDRNGVTDEEGRPDVEIVVALVGRLNAGTESDLLVTVNGVDVEAVVIDSDLVVGVAGRDGDLDTGGDEVSSGDIEEVDGGVLDDEFGLCRLKNGPNKEDCEEDEEEKNEDSGVDSTD
ncbi:hypothetical protein E5676_scaffold21333G00010 [Cucumis melo var. makuwa]|uniref:Uncharacterized protein n=1 Tax=Cucumis melo var. makuwa TaxID=1194695 RepID=A0A5D3BXB8_CUCMM|nr:hypothetical protein E5676_scaffold21333G00010 [Cucumis melo var. makuwa]